MARKVVPVMSIHLDTSNVPAGYVTCADAHAQCDRHGGFDCIGVLCRSQSRSCSGEDCPNSHLCNEARTELYNRYHNSMQWGR